MSAASRSILVAAFALAAVAPFACAANDARTNVAQNATLEIPTPPALPSSDATAHSETLPDASVPEPAPEASATPGDGVAGTTDGVDNDADPRMSGSGIGLGAFGPLDGGIVVRAMKSPKLREGDVIVTGKLDRDVVRRIIRQNFGHFRFCYDAGLRKSPKLAGTVTVRISIDGKGLVTSASDGGSKLADAGVVACVVRSLRAISFPEPESGTVTVDYTVGLAPAD